MIVRMWHGRTRAEDAERYFAFLEERAIPDYRRIPGNAGVWLLRRIEGDVAHFITMTHWSSREVQCVILMKCATSPSMRRSSHTPALPGMRR